MPRDDHFQDISVTGNVSPSETTRITNDWVPFTSATEDLGTSALRWRKLWVQDVDASGVLTGFSTADTPGSIQHVDSVTGSDADNGLSWVNAKVSLSAAFAALPSTGGIVYSAGNQTLSSDPFTGMTKNVQVILLSGTTTCNVAVTVPLNVTLEIRKGALVHAATGITVQVNGEVIAPFAMQCFSRAGTGVVLVTARAQGGEYSARWWGAIGDGATDDSGAFQQAISSAQANAGGGYVRVTPSPTFSFYRTTTALTFSAPPQARHCVLYLQNGIHVNGDLVLPTGWHIWGAPGGANSAGAFLSDLATRVVGQTGTITEAIIKFNSANQGTLKNIDISWNGTSTASCIYIKGGANIKLDGVFAALSNADTANTCVKIEGPAQQVYAYNSVFSSGNQVTSQPVIDIYGVGGQTNAGNTYFEDCVFVNHGIRNRAGGNGGFGGMVLNRCLHESVLSATVQVDTTSSSGTRWVFIQTNQSDLAATTGKALWEHTAGIFPCSDLTFIGCAEPIGVGHYVDNTLAQNRITNVFIGANQNNGVNLRPTFNRFVSRTLPKHGFSSPVLAATPYEILGTGLVGSQLVAGMQFP